MFNALYTMCYKDVLDVCPTLTDGIVWDTEEHTQKLLEMIYSKFFNYEISGETIPEQKVFMTAKFNEYKDYYREMLIAYETQISWLDGVIVSETVGTTEGKVKTVTPRAEYEKIETPEIVVTGETYDLPRTASTENRPSSKTVSTPSGTITTTNRGIDGEDTTQEDNDYNRELSRKEGNPIEQKREYLKLIRSVYSEFADKFKPCFITMFS